MRRRFLSYDLFQTIIPVFAVSISAPLSTWKNAVHILTTRSRESGGINVGKYAVDIASSNYVCTMGDTQSIDCHMTPSGPASIAISIMEMSQGIFILHFIWRMFCTISI